MLLCAHVHPPTRCAFSSACHAAKPSSTISTPCRPARQALHARSHTFASDRKGCRVQCASSPDQQTSTSGRQESQQSLSHSDRYRRGQKGMPYKLITSLAVGGLALTAYLAISKLSGAPVVCLASGGCGSVLNSEYATVFGIPLSLLGLGAYSAIAALGVKGVLSQSSRDPVSRYGVLAGGAVLASCSASLL